MHLKNLLVSAPVLAYHSKHPFILETAASTKGLGAVLAQEQEDGKVHPVAFASQSLSPNEQNYAITELETLGLVWQPSYFVRTCWDTIVLCLQIMLPALPSSTLGILHPKWCGRRWSFKNCSGKSNYVANALSRNPVEVANVLAFQSVESPPSSLTPESDIGKLQRCDKEFLPIFQFFENGVLPADEKARKLMERSNFEIINQVLYYHNPAIPDVWRIAVPHNLRPILLKENHGGRFAGHFAERKLYATLQARYWWPGMRGDVCKFCRSCLASRKGPGRAKVAAYPCWRTFPYAGCRCPAVTSLPQWASARHCLC